MTYKNNYSATLKKYKNETIDSKCFDTDVLCFSDLWKTWIMFTKKMTALLQSYYQRLW